MDPNCIQISRSPPNFIPSHQDNKFDLETIVEEILEVIKDIDEISSDPIKHALSSCKSPIENIFNFI